MGQMIFREMMECMQINGSSDGFEGLMCINASRISMDLHIGIHECSGARMALPNSEAGGNLSIACCQLARTNDER